MIKFMTWYFPIKLVLTAVICYIAPHVILKEYSDLTFLIYLAVDLIILPVVITAISLFRRKKLRAGEYKVKPEGRHL